jgi:hypothetical protein
MKTVTTPALEDETLTTELMIMPDGRIYVFGASRQVLEIMESLQPNDERLMQLLTHVRKLEQQA